MPGMYTWGEVLGIANHTVRGARQVVKNGHESRDGGHGARVDRINERAQERRDRQAAVAFQALDAAENDLARAEHALRVAKGPDKTAARRARNEAKDRARRADSAARRFR